MKVNDYVKNYLVVWVPSEPDFKITNVRSISNGRGYHQSWYEVQSRNPLDDGMIAGLIRLGLVGRGQDHAMEGMRTTVITALPRTVSRDTGEVLENVPPLTWDGKPFTTTCNYTYFIYTIRCICDSGD